MNFTKLLTNRSLQTISVLVLFSLSAHLISIRVLRILFTNSLLIKDILLWILPIIICFYIAASLAKFENKAPLFVLLLVIFEACSNFTSVWYSYFMGWEICNFVSNVNNVDQNIVGLTPYFKLSEFRPDWWSASKGTIIGLCFGIICSRSKFHNFRNRIYKIKSIVEYILTKIFARLIPLFVLGFVANIYVMNILENIFLKFIVIIFWVLIAVFLYLFTLFTIASKFNIYKTIKSIANLFQAGLVALTSGCSISTMPLTISGTSKNLKNPEFAQMVIPATTNIQQIGDCIVNALLSLVILKSFGHDFPDFFTWLQFSVIFTLARFATAAVLGGAIFIMLPIYESYLGFSGEMIAVILAFNVLLDPIVTASNVMGNAALCKILENVWGTVEKIKINLKPTIIQKSKYRI